jgi:hypothetical protein
MDAGTMLSPRALLMTVMMPLTGLLKQRVDTRLIAFGLGACHPPRCIT